MLICGCNESVKSADTSGIWSIDYFVDTFGEITKEPFVKSTFSEGKYQKYTTEVAQLRLIVADDPNNNLHIEIQVYCPTQYFGGFLSDFTIKVSADGVDPIIFKSTFNEDIGRFIIKGDNARELFNLLTSVETCDIKGKHSGLFMNSSFAFQLDSLSGLQSVYKRYKSLK